MKETPTVYRERVSDLQETDFNHWSDIKSPANLIRYIVTSVFTLTTPKQFLGILVAGDVVEGKTPICVNALEALGNGFTGLYTVFPTGDTFQRTCSAYYKDKVLGTKALTTHIDAVPRKLLQWAYSSTPGHAPVAVAQVSKSPQGSAALSPC